MSNLKKIGALWKNKGEGYSGDMELSDGEKIRIVLFKNGFKESEKHPDLVLHSSPNEQNKPAPSKGRPKRKEPPEPEPREDADIPF